MKLSVGLIAAIAGGVAASQPSGNAYMVPRPATSTTAAPFISKTQARMILLQRLAVTGKGVSLGQEMDGPDTELLVSLINDFGKEPAPLFSNDESPRQLVVMMEGMAEEQIDEMGRLLEDNGKFGLAYKVFDPPSQTAHDSLAMDDVTAAGVASDSDCTIQQLSDITLNNCWGERRSVFKRVNVAENKKALVDLTMDMDRFRQSERSVELETTILLLPSTAKTASTTSWSDDQSSLRRRQAEQVMSAFDEAPDAEPTSDTYENHDYFFYAAKDIPTCFNSEDSCNTGTGNCSGHGNCLDKYAGSSLSGSKRADSCFQCSCLSTTSEQDGRGSVTHWAGPTCAKKDISVAFWLFAGFTIILLLVLTLAIQALFNVGEEKLPGVIGAGVSRSK